MQQWAPIVTRSKFKMKTSSPIQANSPMLNFQGRWILTRGLITTPLPTWAPNNRRTEHFQAEGIGHAGRNIKHLIRYHAASTNLGRPRSRPRPGSKRSFRTRVILLWATEALSAHFQKPGML